MDVELLNEGFRNFAMASKSLETYYGLLQERVAYLSVELEKKNRELKTALAEVERNKDYLNAILYNLQEAIIVVDPYDKAMMINKAAEKLLGIHLSDVIGKTFTNLDFSITTDGSETFLFVGEKKHNIILSNSSVVDSEGCLLGKVILINDITRLRELEIHHERNQRLIAMGEMAAKIVHEIRNPLCGIELYSSMLEKELEEAAHKGLARGISKGIASLNNILTNMLLFAKHNKPVMKTMKLNWLIEETTRVFMPLMESRKIKFNSSFFDYEISGDRELLKQTFMNIIINAIHSVHDDGEISIIMRNDDGFVTVDVMDNGEGIKDEYLEKIFDPFFTTKDTGTGLGLTIASRIIQAHGGYIRVWSEEKKGSTFSLYFSEREKAHLKVLPPLLLTDRAFQKNIYNNVISGKAKNPIKIRDFSLRSK